MPARKRGWCIKHYTRWRTHGDVSMVKRRAHKRTGTINAAGYRIFFVKGRGYIYEHHIVAERAIGKPLPRGAEIHHVDENKADNAGANLVICPDRAYHLLLHQRTRAFEACGHAGWRKCNVCKQHDDPAQMYVHGKTAYHNSCKAQQNRSALKCQII